MPANYAVDLDFYRRIQPKIRQYEITHGMPMPANEYRALIEGSLGVAAREAREQAVQSEAVSLERERVDLAKENAKKADRAAAIGGAVDLASTAGVGYLGYKQLGILGKQAASYDKLVEGLAGSKVAPAIELAPDASGVFSAPTAEAAGYGLTAPGASAAVDLGAGAQAALSPGGAAAVAEGAQAAVAAPEVAGAVDIAAYDAAISEGAAEGVGLAGGEAAGAGAGTVALAGAAGWATGHVISKLTGANEDISQGLEFGGAGIAAGFTIGGPVGAVIGGVIGLGVSLFDDSVICTELLRQGRITLHAKMRCVVFKRRYISEEMFGGYLLWAGPHVSAMRRGGWRNRIRLPFAHAFVRYMVKMTSPWRPKITWFERLVYDYAFWRCRRIAAAIDREVSHGELA